MPTDGESRSQALDPFVEELGYDVPTTATA